VIRPSLDCRANSAQIIAGTNKIEYRKIKPYWAKGFAKLSVPFELDLLYGMNPPVAEVTVLIHRITKDRRAQELGQAAAEAEAVNPQSRSGSALNLRNLRVNVPELANHVLRGLDSDVRVGLACIQYDADCFSHQPR
jgi:hypothetical protein